jgi:hypothetical protein
VGVGLGVAVGVRVGVIVGVAVFVGVGEMINPSTDEQLLMIKLMIIK